MSNYNYFYIILPLFLLIEWIVMKSIENKIVNILGAFSEEKIPKLTFYGKILTVMTLIYTFTVIVIVYFQFKSLIEFIIDLV